MELKIDMINFGILEMDRAFVHSPAHRKSVKNNILLDDE